MMAMEVHTENPAIDIEVEPRKATESIDHRDLAAAEMVFKSNIPHHCIH